MNYRNLISFIERSSIEQLYNFYEIHSREFAWGGYDEYVKCHVRYRLKQYDIKRLIWNLFIKRLWKKPYLDAFNAYLPPAFYVDDDDAPPTFYNGIKLLKDHIGEIKNIKYEDDRSYDVLADILYYRLASDKRILFQNTEHLKDMYFDNHAVNHFRKDWSKCVVDCGAYNGDTVRSLIRKKKDYGKIYCFEANKQNFGRLEKCAGKFQNITCFNNAVGNESVNIATQSDGVSSRVNHFSEANDHESIRMVRIDDAISEPITFIKMDIEGEELNALKGAKEHIISDRPAMAISLYHKLQDIYTIPSYIHELDSSYRFLLRKYGETISELVLYVF